MTSSNWAVAVVTLDSMLMLIVALLSVLASVVGDSVLPEAMPEGQLGAANVTTADAGSGCEAPCVRSVPAEAARIIPCLCCGTDS
mmetsp:Transcript_15283/g.27236  ORF Transcript_15283/g.27236 Transcript_15283/m.27236 type:complete len:85 (-) Transcript_15283:743-997(-)